MILTRIDGEFEGDIAPADLALSNSELGIEKRYSRESVLKRALANLGGYDVCVCNCSTYAGITLVATGEHPAGKHAAGYYQGGLSVRAFSADEDEADEEGMKLILASGIDPQGMIAFFETIQKQGGGSPPQWMLETTVYSKLGSLLLFTSSEPAVALPICRATASMFCTWSTA